MRGLAVGRGGRWVEGWERMRAGTLGGRGGACAEPRRVLSGRGGAERGSGASAPCGPGRLRKPAGSPARELAQSRLACPHLTSRVLFRPSRLAAPNRTRHAPSAGSVPASPPPPRGPLRPPPGPLGARSQSAARVVCGELGPGPQGGADGTWRARARGQG